MAHNGVKVVLHVYDLSQGLARQMSLAILGKMIEAVYHTGVVVYGREYSFGMGIESEPLGLSRYGIPIQRLELGYTEVPKELFEEYLDDIRPRYTAQTYSLLRHNCNNFSDEVVQFLVGGRVPSHILNLPQEVLSTPMGASLVPMLEQIEAGARLRTNPQAAAVAPNVASHPLAGGSSSAAQGPAAVRVTPLASSAVSSASAPSASVPVRTPAERTAPATATRTSVASGSDLVSRAPPAAGPRPESRTSQETNPTSRRGTGGSAASSVSGAGGNPAEEKARIHGEIQKEFALLMAAGQLQANEAAVQAVQRVMERNRAAVAGSSRPQA